MSDDERTIMEGEPEAPKVFNLDFQMSILKLSLYDDFFCAQTVRMLGDEKELRDFQIFQSVGVQIIFEKIVSAYKTYGTRPTETQIKQMIYSEPDKAKKDRPGRKELELLLDKILQMDVRNEDYLKEELTTFVRRAKFKMYTKKVVGLYSEHPDDAPSYMQKYLDDINKISFEKDDIVTLDDLDMFLEESASSISKTISTGIPELDDDLLGGLPTESLVSVLAGTNVGKSMFCASLGCNALRATDSEGNNLNHKVLYVALEGMRSESIMRMASNLAGVKYANMLKGQLSDEDKDKIKVMKEKYLDKIKVKNALDFDNTIEGLMAGLSEIHKNFPFTMCIVDYGQLLSTSVPTDGHRFVMARVYRGLAALSRMLNCVVISPVQATRQGQETQSVNLKNARQQDAAPILRSSDISEAFEIARVSGVILSLNMTDDEREEGKLRVFLEKQRLGVKGKQYGCITDFPHCNLIPGQFYDPNANIIEEKSDDDSGSLDTVGKDKGYSFDINKALGEGQSLDFSKKMGKMDYLVQEILESENKLKDINDEMIEIKNENPLEIDDEEGLYRTLEREYAALDKSLKELKTDYLKLFESVHEHANDKALEFATLTYNDFKSNAKKDDEEKLADLEKLKERLEMGLRIKDEK